MLKPQTNFEQIPVEVVKRIADPLIVNEETENPVSENASIQAPSSAPKEEWRGLAEQIQGETDSDKMLDLVQQLIAKYDESKMKRPIGRNPR